MFFRSAICQDDEFVYFRCDACSATFFKVNKTFSERHRHRTAMPSFEFVEILEDICESGFTKHEFGVKQYEGKKYLFGPGVIDHIPDLGFGQMGMGDYDKRLSAYCRAFIEEVGEEELQSRWREGVAIDKTKLCAEECKFDSSGAAAPSKRKQKPRPLPHSMPPPPAPQPAPSKKRKPPPDKEARDAADRLEKAEQAEKRKRAAQEALSPQARAQPPENTESGSSAGDAALGRAFAALPSLSASQLRALGEGVLSELARRVEAPSFGRDEL